MKVLLLGNPNAGKTTLFNALTGENQRIGNWPGVTVDQKKGFFSLSTSVPHVPASHESVELIDLPGVYSLNAMVQGASPDELITLRALAHSDADCIINVVDACHLERHLYLTSQLLELGKPVILALNMMDIAALRGIELDVPELAKQLSCPVIPIQAHQQLGLDELKKALLTLPSPSKPLDLLLSAAACTAIASIRHYLQQHDVFNFSETMINYSAWRIAEGDAVLVEKSVLDALHAERAGCVDLDLILADARYGKIHQLVAHVQSKRSDASEYLTARIDRIVLHRYLAFPFFLAAMYLMFLFAINVGGLFQDFFDISSNAIFVQGAASLLERIHAPQWLIALLAHGVGQGINTTVTFIPVLASMYFFLALLESSGYMARAAFVVDKLMRVLGLPGKAFVPMIVGFGCNVPAIMAARTLDSERDRILTVLMSPFMSCSARLAIYAVFVAAFFPTGGQNIVFSLYLVGIVMAVFTGFILRKTTLQGTSSSLILELPAYHRPSLKRLLRETNFRLRYFIVRAGSIIIPVCVVLGGLNALTIDGYFSALEANTHSVLSVLGQWITPIFTPMGIQPDNWPATVGLLTGMLAKEVVIGTLNSLYVDVGHIAHPVGGSFDILLALKAAVGSIAQNWTQMTDALFNPVLASAPLSEVSHSVYGEMVSRFDGKSGAFAYLLFILLYIPCVSTMAAIRQETSRELMWFSVAWSFLMAYVVSVVFYQGATFFQHPVASLSWLLGLGCLVVGMIAFLHCRASSQRGRHVAATA